MKAFDIIFWGRVSLNEGWRLTVLSMAEALSKKNRILYIEPTMSLGSRLRKKIKRQSEVMPPVARNDNFVVYSPLYTIPFNRLALIRKINDLFISWHLKRTIRKLRFTRYINWFYKYKDFLHIVKLKDSIITIFEVVDDKSLFPIFKNEKDRDEFKKAQDEVIKQVDYVFTQSSVLAQEKKPLNNHAYYFSMGSGIKHFRRSLLDSTNIPNDIASIPKPIVGFIGAMDGYKLDFNLISYAASQRPGYSFVFIGPTGITDNTQECSLPQAANIYYLGVKPYNDLPGYIKAFDVAIIPNNIKSTYIKFNFPFKFFEFLASGKPTITTNIPSLREFKDVAHISLSNDEFVTNIDLVLCEDSDDCKRKRLERVRNFTWENRVERMLEKINEIGLAEKTYVVENFCKNL